MIISDKYSRYLKSKNKTSLLHDAQSNFMSVAQYTPELIV